MKRFMLATLGVILVVGLATALSAAGVPWKAGGDKAASATPGDLKAELPPAQYNRVVKPIETKIQAAEQAMKPYEKEMQKPAEKRNQRLLLACKERAASMYLGASLAAKKALNMVKEDSHKAAIKQQYEEPNRQKAIDIFLELAMAARDKGDLRTAVAYYRRILAIDKENTRAKEAIVKIAKEVAEAAQNGSKTGSKGGGSDDPRSWDRDDYKRTGRGDGNWSGTGRGW